MLASPLDEAEDDDVLVDAMEERTVTVSVARADTVSSLVIEASGDDDADHVANELEAVDDGVDVDDDEDEEVTENVPTEGVAERVSTDCVIEGDTL